MFENLEELLRTANCSVQTMTEGRWLCWGDGAKTWFVMERKRYAKKTRTLYQGNDLREAMQFLR